MDRTRRIIGRPTLASEIASMARIEVPFHSIALPKSVVRREVGRMRIERAQPRVESLIVPHIKELAGPISQVLMVVFDWSAKRLFELREIAIDLHVFGRTRRQSANTRGELRGPQRSRERKQN